MSVQICSSKRGKSARRNIYERIFLHLDGPAHTGGRPEVARGHKQMSVLYLSVMREDSPVHLSRIEECRLVHISEMRVDMCLVHLSAMGKNRLVACP